MEVAERNRADDTFGFGIVLSDETLSNLRRADEPSYREIAANFAYWDDIYTHFKGHGSVERARLLRHPAPDAAPDPPAPRRGLGVKVRSRRRTRASPPIATPTWSSPPTASTARCARSSRCTSSRRSRRGEPVRLARRADDAARLHLQLSGGQGRHLEPARLHVAPGDARWWSRPPTRRSRERPRRRGRAGHRRTWQALRRGAEPRAGAHEPLVLAPVPGRACVRWHHDNAVLLGDAAHTAHWSIGSGTKLALEDAIALHQAVIAHPGTCARG